MSYTISVVRIVVSKMRISVLMKQTSRKVNDLLNANISIWCRKL